MVKCRCIEKIRDEYKRIVGYVLIDTNSNTMKIDANALKNSIANGEILVENLRLDNLGRLVNVRSEDEIRTVNKGSKAYEDKEAFVKEIIDFINKEHLDISIQHGFGCKVFRRKNNGVVNIRPHVYIIGYNRVYNEFFPLEISIDVDAVGKSATVFYEDKKTLNSKIVLGVLSADTFKKEFMSLCKKNHLLVSNGYDVYRMRELFGNNKEYSREDIKKICDKLTKEHNSVK